MYLDNDDFLCGEGFYLKCVIFVVIEKNFFIIFVFEVVIEGVFLKRWRMFCRCKLNWVVFGLIVLFFFFVVIIEKERW